MIRVSQPLFSSLDVHDNFFLLKVCPLTDALLKLLLLIAV